MTPHRTLTVFAAILACTGTAALSGMGFNLGNTMEAPIEGEWNRPAQLFYFDDIAAVGFTHVRIPIRWDTHIDKTPPYAVNSSWVSRVKTVVGYCLVNGLSCIINSHDDKWLDNATTFDAQLPRFAALWMAVGAAFADAPPALLFEAYNEPGKMTTAQLNMMLAAFYGAVRPKNPDRLLLLGWLGAMNPGWVLSNNRANWDAMLWNRSDSNILVECHSYDPFASCGGQAQQPWTPSDLPQMDHMFGNMSEWSAAHGDVQILFGEFGCIAHQINRVGWYTAFAQRCRSTRGIVGCSVWDDGGGFALYNRTSRVWNATLLSALGMI